MDDGAVADAHIASHQGWKTWVAVNHGVILDVGSLAESDLSSVSPQYCTKHHHRSGMNAHLSSECCGWRNEGVIGNCGVVGGEAKEWHRPSLEGPSHYLGAPAFSSSLVLHGGL
jgi:hypothetical protein